MKKKKPIIIVAALAVLALIGVVVGKKESGATAPVKSKAQQDSIALVKIKEKGKREVRYNLANYVKNKLNDPKSFDILESKAYDAGDSTIVAVIEYTAKNGFGGTIRKVIKAEANPYGQLTKVFE